MIDLSSYDNSDYRRGVARWTEFAWWVVRSLFFAPWFPVPSAIKVLALRCFGARVGKGVIIRNRVNITMPWKLEIGDHVWLGDEVLVLSLAPVSIGSNVCISQRAVLCTGSHDFRKEGFDLITEPINIGDGSWICAQAFVGAGAKIPEKTMLKAGATWTEGDNLD